METTYVTTAEGHDLPLTSDRNPSAAFHFTQVGRTQNGIVWRASEIQGRSLLHRLTFTSYYDDRAAKTWGMGRLLHHEMQQQERVARWEADLAAQHQMIAFA